MALSQPVPIGNDSATREPLPNFPGFQAPSIDFGPVRDERRAKLFYLDVDLTAARSIAASTSEVINVAGNSFYVDQDTANVGNGIVHFQDSTLSRASAPVYVGPGFIARVPYTQLLIENAAQPGKRLRIFYGVDIDFQAGVNASITLLGQNGSFVDSQFSVTNGNQVIVAANVARRYLLIQNNDGAQTLRVSLDGTAATATKGKRLAPGQSIELQGYVATTAINAMMEAATATANNVDVSVG